LPNQADAGDGKKLRCIVHPFARTEDMKQPIPEITENDVFRIVRRDFPTEQFDAAMSILNEYGTEDWQHRVQRVRLAVLKLACGDLQALRREIDVAKNDYRDALAYAEYPEYMQKVSPSGGLADAKRERIIRADWAQYQSWLNKSKTNKTA